MACGLTVRELEQLTSPCVSLRPLVLEAVNSNFMLLSSVTTPKLAPVARGVPPAPSPDGAKGEVAKGAIMCAVSDCIGYGAKTTPPYQCTHIITRGCDACGLMHVRTGTRKWSCEQAAALQSVVDSLPARGAAFKLSYESYVSDARVGKLDPAGATTAKAVKAAAAAAP